MNTPSPSHDEAPGNSENDQQWLDKHYPASTIERRPTLESSSYTDGTDESRIVGRAYEELPQPRIRQQQGFMREIVETLLLVVAIYTLVNLSTARFVVEGSSMEPSFYTDEFVIVSRLAYVIGEPERGDVIVFHYDEEGTRDFIKRVVGLPGEHVEIVEGRVYINGLILDEPYVDEYCRCDGEWLLEDDQYIVLGDNRDSSRDSQDFGPIDRDQIIGRAWIRYWPPEAWQVIPHHDYGLPNNLPPSDSSAPVDETETDDLEEIPFRENIDPGSF